MRDKHPIHTNLSTEAMRILERYEKELGNKNTVLERALFGMDKLRFKEKINPQDINRIIKRVKTGTPGFDELIEGGIPKGFIIAITGPPGVGKTTFSMQFLIEGVKNNERCIFFSFEEKVEQIARTAARFGWDINKYLTKGLLEIFGTTTSGEEIMEVIKVFKPDRIVFDSLNAFITEEARKSAAWRNVYKLLKETDQVITTFVVTEKTNGQFDQFDFISDGVITFGTGKAEKTDTGRYFMKISKMRTTKIDGVAMNFSFGEAGIQIVAPNTIDSFKDNQTVKQIEPKPEILIKAENSDDNKSVKELIIFRIKEENFINQKEVEKETGITSINLDKLVQELEKENFVTVVCFQNSPEKFLCKGKKLINNEAKEKLKTQTLLIPQQLTMGQLDVLAKTKISLVGINILRLVIETPGITQTELSIKLNASKALVYKLVKEFSVRGLLNKIKIGRSRNIAITPVKEKIMQEMKELIQKGLIPILKDMPVSSFASIDSGKTDENASLKKIAQQANLNLAQSAIDIVKNSLAKVMPIDQLAEKLKTNKDILKRAIESYKASGGKEIEIEEAGNNYLVILE